MKLNAGLAMIGRILRDFVMGVGNQRESSTVDARFTPTMEQRWSRHIRPYRLGFDWCALNDGSRQVLVSFDRGHAATCKGLTCAELRTKISEPSSVVGIWEESEGGGLEPIGTLDESSVIHMRYYDPSCRDHPMWGREPSALSDWSARKPRFGLPQNPEI